MKATNLINERINLSGSTFVQIVVWEIQEPVLGSDHLYKFRLALIVDQICIMRYDNEAGKGGHKHINDQEIDYTFTTPEQLLSDFWADVEALT